MIADGADIIDIGGESSRPGVAPVPLDEELRRVMPVLYALRDCGKPLSIDTYKPEVMREALAAGADMINDIAAFARRARCRQSRTALAACASCICKAIRKPCSSDPSYQDVRGEVGGFPGKRACTLRSRPVWRASACVSTPDSVSARPGA